MTMLGIICSFLLFAALSNSQPLDTEANYIDPSEAFHQYIIGGTNTIPGVAPYQVSLQTPNRFHFCGGCIVTNQWILTASHCCHFRTPDMTIVVAGSVELDNGVVYKSSKIIMHPYYNPDTLKNDISLIRTETNIQFSAIVQPINIGTDFIHQGESLILTGWGYTKHPGGTVPDQLQLLPVKAISNERCQTLHQSQNPEYIFDESLCAVADSVGRGACMGDSGGPLIHRTTDGRCFVIGIVSWGVPCGVGFPDIFTRVSSFSEWIFNVMKNN